MKKDKYRTLILGSDGRAHALFRSCMHSPLVDHLIVAPGNGGILEQHRRNVDLMDFADVVALCKAESIDIIVVSPEAPLVGNGKVGITDYVKEHLPTTMVFGPSALAAKLEGSKNYCNRFAGRYDVKMAPGTPAHSFESAAANIAMHLQMQGSVVVKMDGLAAGKGVLVTSDEKEARAFAEVGLKRGALLIQEKLTGPEVSFICFVSGSTVVPLVPARDFKRAHDDDLGPNTGGMGAYAPLPEYPTDGPVYAQMLAMAQKVADGCVKEKHPYVGLLYLGLMVVDDVVYLIEINCRGGSPETEVLLALVKGDIFPYFVACCEGTLAEMPPVSFHEGAAVCVVVASKGYPNSTAPRARISRLWFIHMDARGVSVKHAGTRQTKEGGYETTGGRVFMLTARGPDIKSARDTIYGALGSAGTAFEDAWWRTDIAAGV